MNAHMRNLLEVVANRLDGTYHVGVSEVIVEQGLLLFKGIVGLCPTAVARACHIQCHSITTYLPRSSSLTPPGLLRMWKLWHKQHVNL